MCMLWTRGAVTATVLALLATAGGCGGSSGQADAGGAGTGGGGAGGGGGGGTDAATADGPADLATDFGAPMTSDAAINCPTGGGALAPASAAVLIDDFTGMGKLNGRSRVGAGFEIKEQFDATDSARFDPEPGLEPKCGAAATGAAHVRGKAADTGATFSVIFSSAGDAGKRDHYDASAAKGITFRVALGNPKAAQLVTVQLNLAGTNKFDYTKDVIVGGTVWQEVKILWTDLMAAPAAPAFSPAMLNQIVIPFAAGEDVDLYIDDLAFLP